jgi:prevent-host-death family protein
MQRLGIRELQQDLPQVVKRVRAGERIEVIERGRAVAMLVPVSETGVLDDLAAAGRLTRAASDLLDVEPLRLRARVERPSRRLASMRAHER